MALLYAIYHNMNRYHNNVVSNQALHKPVCTCTVTEDGSMLQNSDLGSRGIVLSK